MSQTGYTPILIYSSTTAAQAPAAGNLTNSTLGSELAINITDGKLFYKDNANAVQVIGWKVTPTTAGGTGLTSYTAGDLLYYATGTTLSKLAIGASGFWLGSSGTAPQWNAPAALTKTDDTNVTLTLGGSASTALLNAASLTLGWTGTLATTRGGTGLSSFTSGGIVYASSTSALATSGNFKYDGTNFSMNVTAYAAVSKINLGDGTDNSTTVKTTDILVTPDDNTWKGSGAGMRVNREWLNVSYLDFLVSNGGARYSALRIEANGDTKVNSGNLVIGTSGKGIDFSATSGTGTSELLADYEEGTWTPVATSGAGSITSYTSSGTYTKVGNTITVFGKINITNAGTASGNLNFSGLPFTSKNLGSYVDIVLSREDNVTGVAYTTLIAGNATTGIILSANWTNNVLYLFSATYLVA